MKNIKMYAVMMADDMDVNVVMVFDNKENADMYKEQIQQENYGTEFFFYIEETKGIISI